MARIFFALSLFSILVLVGVIISGFTIGDFNSATRDVLQAKLRVRRSQQVQERDAAQQEYDQALERFRPLRRRNSWHTIFGTAGALIALLINSLSVTYFIGTGKWCGEVVETYGLKADLASESRQLKRRCFPWSMLSIVLLLLLIASGAASDPLAMPSYSGSAPYWVAPHWILAVVATPLMALSFWIQVGYIGAHYEVIQTILGEVRRIRSQRGLDDDGVTDGSLDKPMAAGQIDERHDPSSERGRAAEDDDDRSPSAP